MEDMVNISIGNAGIIGLLGYLVVFFGLILLMCVVMAMASVFIRKAKKNAEAVVEAPVVEEAPAKAEIPAAPGSAGDIKLYDTDPRDAAVIMAIVADKLGKPINELRFKSIKEVSSNEI